jgi:hypothetical protein
MNELRHFGRKGEPRSLHRIAPRRIGDERLGPEGAAARRLRSRKRGFVPAVAVCAAAIAAGGVWVLEFRGSWTRTEVAPVRSVAELAAPTLPGSGTSGVTAAATVGLPDRSALAQAAASAEPAPANERGIDAAAPTGAPAPNDRSAAVPQAASVAAATEANAAPAAAASDPAPSPASIAATLPAAPADPAPAVALVPSLPQAPAAAAVATEPPIASPAAASGRAPVPASALSPRELQRMIARASELLRLGDISGARLLLERASSAGEGRATFALAETYDPNVLARWGARGIRGDVAKAKELYARALSDGMSEATIRITDLK